MVGPYLVRTLVRRIRSHTYARVIDVVLLVAAAGMLIAACR